MTEKATSTFVHIAILWVCTKLLSLKGNKFSVNISCIMSPKVDVRIGGLG